MMNALLGAVKDYVFRRKHIYNIWGGAFNGQLQRREIFENITSQTVLKLIVETGTFKGNTTAYMNKVSNLPVLSVEHDRRNYYFSKLRFILSKDIRIFNSDSRVFLERIEEYVSLNAPTLFYLDAHWDDDLPLRKELEIILTKFSNPLIIIDDFKVPHDLSFNYDKYGDNELSIDLISDLLEHTKLNLFFPKSSVNETGAKRGYIIISGVSNINASLKSNSQLLEHRFD